jgi:hypothetical protein
MNNTVVNYFAVGLLVFFIVRLLVRWIINGGLVSEIYRRLVYPRRMSRAYQRADAGLVPATFPDDQDYRAKLEELSAFRYERRLLALRYFEQKSPSKELVNKLSEVIPRQHRDEVKMEMIRLLCQTTHQLRQTIGLESVSRQDIQIRIMPWSFAISMWVTFLIMMGVGLVSKPLLSVSELLAVGLIAYIAIIMPLLIITIRSRSRVVQYSLIFLAVIMAGLWSYSDTVHSGQATTDLVALDIYGFSNLTMEIRYPRWLTVDDTSSCSKALNVTIMGDSVDQPQPLEIKLDYRHDVLYATNQKCEPPQPLTFSKTNTSTTSAEIVLKPLNSEALLVGGISITPRIRHLVGSPNEQPIGERTFTIWLEDPIWKSIRDLCRLGLGVTSVPAFLWVAYDRLVRKKDKL